MSEEDLDYLRDLVMPRLQSSVERLRVLFPHVEIQAFEGELGRLTSYQGYHLGIDCELFRAAPPRTLGLEISVRRYRSDDAEIDDAGITWGAPDGDSEGELLESPRKLTKAAADEVSTGLDSLLTRLEAALQRASRKAHRSGHSKR